MITEDYVSCEVAKLLKEKGFKEITQGYINIDREVYMCPFQQGVYELGDKQFPYPTHQMAVEWIRQKYNLHIMIDRRPDGYAPCVRKIPSGEAVGGTIDIRGIDCAYDKYENAVEAALKYTLENLI